MDWKFHRLVAAIQLLAEEPSKQLGCFPEFVGKADEIALLFDDCAVFLPGLVRTGAVSDEASRLVKEVDALLADMSNDQQLWTDDAVRFREEWRRVRELAKCILVAMDAPVETPQLDWISFTPGGDTGRQR